MNLNKDYKNNLNKNNKKNFSANKNSEFKNSKISKLINENEESYKIDEWENSRSNKNKISNNTNFLQSTKKKSKNFL